MHVFAGFNSESAEYKNLNITSFDTADPYGNVYEKLVPIWRHFRNTDALVYVVDSSAVDSMPKLAQQLQVRTWLSVGPCNNHVPLHPHVLAVDGRARGVLSGQRRATVRCMMSSRPLTYRGEGA